MSSIKNAVVALITIASLLGSPYLASAQNWTPPTQAPTGGNVPAPINEGPLLQRKQGGLDLQGPFRSFYSSRLYSDTIVEPDTNGTGRFVNFLESFFYGNVSIGDGTPFNGSGNEIPADFSLYGKFKYQTADSAGNPEPVNPGYVLVTNDEGYTEWADPSTITGGGNGNLPFADEQGATLYWDIATNTWKVANNVKINQDAATGFSASGPLGSLKVNNQGLTTVDGALRVTLDYAPDSTGKVLKAMDGTGLVTWGDPLAPGGNDGDVLTWNSTTNQWESTTINIGTGSLPASATIGDTLRWNGTIWDKTSLWQVGTATQPNRAGTGAGVEQLTLTTGMSPTSFVSISSPTVRILPLGSSPVPGHIMTATDFTGKVAWSDPAAVVADAMVDGNDNDTMRYNGDTGFWEATDRITINDDDDSIYINNSDTAEGRFLSSGDDTGKVKWNPYLVYVDNPCGQNCHLNTITIPPNQPGQLTAFANYGGMTYLEHDLKVNGSSGFNGSVIIGEQSPLTVAGGDVSINDGGHLYLEELPGQTNTNNLIHVCWNTDTHRISKCTAYGADPGGFETNDTVTTVTYTPQDNGEHITFTEDASLDITWCGAGGGGGGGGLGAPVSGSNNLGTGGGGGGGGEAGKCETNTFDFTAGQTLSWNIGSGANGGPGGGMYCGPGCQSITTSLAQNGDSGEPTYLLLNGSQLGTTGDGGEGGKFGCSVSQVTVWSTSSPCYNMGQVPNGGDGGSTALATGQYSAWWHNGQFGFNSTYAGTDGGGGGPGYGGMGGDGESPAEGGATAATGSAGGGGGWSSLAPDPFINAYQFFGGNGKDGIVNYGGGGGGGSYGRINENALVNAEPLTKGGNGGDGGDGYIEVTGPAGVINGVAQPDELVYNIPGTYLVNLNDFPEDMTQFSVEVWGGGGGGGATVYNTAINGTYKGGGGGAGAYAKVNIDLTSPAFSDELSCIQNNYNCDWIYIVVGSGGTAGNSAQSPGNATSATSGTSSRFCFGLFANNCFSAYPNITASGGTSGGVGTTTTTVGSAGNGGTVNGTSNTGYTLSPSVPGNPGIATGANAGMGGAGYQGLGNGGFGAKVITQGGFATPSPAASNGGAGGVRIFWQ